MLQEQPTGNLTVMRKNKSMQVRYFLPQLGKKNKTFIRELSVNKRQCLQKLLPLYPRFNFLQYLIGYLTAKKFVKTLKKR